MAKIRMTWIKSQIGYSVDQKRTIKALGLHRLHQTVEHQDTAAIRGMVTKVRHLLKVEEIYEAK